VEQTEVRQSERAAIAIPTQVSTLSEEKIDAEIRDISASGAMLSVKQPVGEIGQKIRVAFDLKFAQISRSLEFAAIIRNVNMVQGQNPPQYRVGIQFQDIAEQDGLFVVGFVYEHLWIEHGSH